MVGERGGGDGGREGGNGRREGAMMGEREREVRQWRRLSRAI